MSPGAWWQTIRQFDLVALQGIQARDPGLLVQLLELANTGGGITIMP